MRRGWTGWLWAISLGLLVGCGEYMTRSDTIAPSVGWAQVVNGEVQTE